MRTPEFVVDLTQEPERRFEEIGKSCRRNLHKLLPKMRKEFLAEFPKVSRGIIQGALDAAINFISVTLAEHEYTRELVGLAYSAGVEFEDLLLANVVYDISAGFKIKGLGCTGFVHGGPPQPLIGRAMDWFMPEGIGKETILIRYRGADYEVISVGFPGVNGVISGMSSVGVAITVNQRTPDDAWISLPNWATPTLWRVREILENSTGYASARRMVTKEEMASPSFLLMCGSKPGEASFVMSDGKNHEVYPIAKGETQAVSNHVPGGTLPLPDLAPSSLERFNAMFDRAAGMPEATIQHAKQAIGLWPVNCDRTVHQMVLCPAEGSLHLRCPDLGQRSYSAFYV